MERHYIDIKGGKFMRPFDFEELKPFKISPITKGYFNILNLSKKAYLFSSSKECYLVVWHSWDCRQESKTIDDIAIKNIKIIKESVENTMYLNPTWGSKEDFIIDMNGIDNFMFSRSINFKDSTIRTIAIQLGILDETKSYLRIGASGAAPTNQHPGGEVFECQMLTGLFAEGIGLSVSGYLMPPQYQYSNSISLSIDNQNLLEDRTIYSHTAWLKKSNLHNSSLHFSILAQANNINLLDLIAEIMKQLGNKAYAIQICIVNNDKRNVTVRGRVLKHPPQIPFKQVQEATEIAVEKEFLLPLKAKLYAVGTYYDRYEPEWEIFTGGHKYERRGHYHATIVNTNAQLLHKTFHLRELLISKLMPVEVILTPINNVYRIYPTHKKGKDVVCNSTNKPISNLIYELNKYYDGN